MVRITLIASSRLWNGEISHAFGDGTCASSARLPGESGATCQAARIAPLMNFVGRAHGEARWEDERLEGSVRCRRWHRSRRAPNSLPPCSSLPMRADFWPGERYDGLVINAAAGHAAERRIRAGRPMAN